MSTLRDLAEEECKLDMTSMIDVTFLLIIFFVCTLKFKTLEGKLSAYLPKSVGVQTGDAERLEKVDVRIDVLAEGARMDPRDATAPWSGEGRHQWVGRRLGYRVGPVEVASLADLRARLAALHASDPERAVTIDARAGTVYGDVVPVLDAAIEAGFGEITFAGAAR